MMYEFQSPISLIAWGFQHTSTRDNLSPSHPSLAFNSIFFSFEVLLSAYYIRFESGVVWHKYALNQFSRGHVFRFCQSQGSEQEKNWLTMYGVVSTLVTRSFGRNSELNEWEVSFRVILKYP